MPRHRGAAGAFVGEIAPGLAGNHRSYPGVQRELVVRNNLVNGMVYRGGDARRRYRPRFPFPKGVKPTLVMLTSVKDIVNDRRPRRHRRDHRACIRWVRRDIKSVRCWRRYWQKQARRKPARRSLDDRGRQVTEAARRRPSS